MLDEFEDLSAALTTPATKAEVVVPDDVAELGFATRALYVGNSGTIVVRLLSGDLVTLPNVQAGVLYPLRIRQVLATGTTATALVGLR